MIVGPFWPKLAHGISTSWRTEKSVVPYSVREFNSNYSEVFSMPIDTTREQLMTFAQAARYARPPGSRPAAPSSLWRWHRHGIAGVKLETICLGGTRYTSAEALQRFFRAVTEAKSGEGEEPGTSSTADGSASRSAMTRERLRRAGLTAD
jgi:hypothetical protein